MNLRIFLISSIVVSILFFTGCKNDAAQQKEKPVLSSWNDGVTKQAIIDFVTKVTTKDSPNYIPEEDRIATFDNDGTLWCEQPLYFEMVYSIDAAKKIIAAKPELAKKPELKALTDKATFAKNPEKGIEVAFGLSHAMATGEFSKIATAWLDTAKQNRFNVKYTELTYLPMVELLLYLRENGFKTYIVSGGSSAFIRQFSDKAYGIPAEQVIGTMLKAEFVSQDNKYNVVFKPEIWHNDDNVGKPVGIEQIIGKKPVLAFGNSDGDLQMLQWTSTNTYPNMCLILHHTDSIREYAYDSLSHVGMLKKALIEGKQKGWTIVDMKNDFKTVFGFQEEKK